MKRWPALDLSLPQNPGGAPDGWQDILAAALDDLGPTAIQEQDDAWRVFFSSAGERDHARRALAAGASWLAAVSLVDVDDEDWARRSQESLRPVKIGRVVVTPPWAADGERDATVLEVVIQPSMGFGTGHHASTRLCTALLQELDLVGRSVLDVGTGSGVLALVALRLGAQSVEGIDNDADALAAATENVELNGLSGRISLHEADFRDLPSLSADIVTANLTGALLARSAVLLSAAVRPGGTLIVSGVTAEEEAAVVNAFQPHLRLASRLAEDGWVGLLFRRA
ncbi:MAG: methyltransferase domain-containing protein [Acidobacteria bacterium]|nr:MAG: methyltransferase domain-containing protein [Acidobacteriota bacterium]